MGAIDSTGLVRLDYQSRLPKSEDETAKIVHGSFPKKCDQANRCGRNRQKARFNARDGNSRFSEREISGENLVYLINNFLNQHHGLTHFKERGKPGNPDMERGVFVPCLTLYLRPGRTDHSYY